MRYVTESSTEVWTRRDHVSNYQIKLYKELRSLARLGIPARRTAEQGVPESPYAEGMATHED